MEDDDLSNKIKKNIFYGDIDLPKDVMHEIELSGQVISYNFVCYIDPLLYATIMITNSNFISQLRIINKSDGIYSKNTWKVVYFTLH